MARFTINGLIDDKSIQYAVMNQADGSCKLRSLGVPSTYANQAALADIDRNVDIPVNGKIQVVVSGNPVGALTCGGLAEKL
jgi:hypothetical protein